MQAFILYLKTTSVCLEGGNVPIHQTKRGSYWKLPLSALVATTEMASTVYSWQHCWQWNFIYCHVGFNKGNGNNGVLLATLLTMKFSITTQVVAFWDNIKIIVSSKGLYNNNLPRAKLATVNGNNKNGNHCNNGDYCMQCLTQGTLPPDWSKSAELAI